MGVFRRIVTDLFDPAAVVTALIFIVFASMVFTPVLSTVQANLFLYTSPRSAFYAIISDLLSNPPLILAFVVYGLILLYTGLVVIGWYGKKRVGLPKNPFTRAVKLVIPAFILGIIIASPFLLAFALYVALYPTVFSWIPLILLAFIVLYYLPVVSPALPALVIREENIKDAIHEGVFVGRRWWWKILLYSVGAFIVLYVISSLLGFLAPYVPPQYIFLVVQALFFVYMYAVVVEVYVRDTFGE